MRRQLDCLQPIALYPLAPSIVSRICVSRITYLRVFLVSRISVSTYSRITYFSYRSFLSALRIRKHVFTYHPPVCVSHKDGSKHVFYVSRIHVSTYHVSRIHVSRITYQIQADTRITYFFRIAYHFTCFYVSAPLRSYLTYRLPAHSKGGFELQSVDHVWRGASDTR